MRFSLLRVLAGAIVALAALAMTSGTAVASLGSFPDDEIPRFPVIAAGMRGTNVLALELVLRSHGVAVGADGTATPAEIANAETRVWQVGGSNADGRVSAADWSSLLSERPVFASVSTPWGPLPQPDSVRAVEELLRSKVKVAGACPGLAVDGWFSTTDAACVHGFQAEVGLSPTGFVDIETWKRLLWHYEPLWLNGDLVAHTCRGASDDGSWLTSSATAIVARGAIYADYLLQTDIAWTDASDEHGGKQQTYHSTHRFGMGIDVRPINVARTHCMTGVDMRHDTLNGSTSACLYTVASDPQFVLSASYDQTATRAMLASIVAAADSGRFIGRIFFNDCATNEFLEQHFPVLQVQSTNGADKVKPWAGHHNHAHISFCEPEPEFVDPGTGWASHNNTCRWS